MCTAVSYLAGDHYFGRNLDLEYRYNESVVITPRNFPLTFRAMKTITTHYAFIGIATVSDGYPLYYDATNECGLSMAGLNFPGNAEYFPYKHDADNIAPFEFIPWILSQCKDLAQVKEKIRNINLYAAAFSDAFPLSALHWIISDASGSLVIETSENGLSLHNDSIGILTNNPPFDFHLLNLTNYINLTSDEPENRFSEHIHLKPFSRGVGAFGLPGDNSSASRFVRAAFSKLNAIAGENEVENISQFFHILGSVRQIYGCVKVGDDFEMTVYSSCCNTTKCIYYYTTYYNSQITSVHLFRENLQSDTIIAYPLREQPMVQEEN